MMKFLNYFLLFFILGVGIFIYNQESPSTNIEVLDDTVSKSTIVSKKILKEENYVKESNKILKTQVIKESVPTLVKSIPQNIKVESLLPINNKLELLISNLDNNLQGKQEKYELVNTLKNAKRYRQLLLEKAKQENMEAKN